MADKKMELIVNVNVVGAGAAVAATSVNTVGIIVTDTVVGTEASDHKYSDSEGVKDVFGATSEAYKMAVRFFSQKRHPDSVYVVRIADKTQAAITAAVSDGALADVFHWVLSLETPDTDAEKISTLALLKGLNSHAAEDYKFYHVEMDATTDAQAVAIKALYDGFTASDVDYAGLTVSQTTRVEISAHNLTAATDDHIAVSIVSDRCGADPARGTWAHKELVGDSPDTMSKAQLKRAMDAGFNVYTSIAKSPRFFMGTSCGPANFIDSVVKADWIKFRVAEAVYELLRDGGDGYGVDLDDNGIAAIGAKVTDVLGTAYKNHYIHEDFTVDLPLYADLPAADKAQRRLSGIKAYITLMDSVHTVVSIDINVQK